MNIQEDNYLAHYGTPRRSGRYPWGSGKDPEQRSRDFLGTIEDLKSKGMTDAEIMRGFDMNTTEFRAAKSIARNQKKQGDIRMARRLKFEEGYSNVAIGERMGINESSVRALLAPGVADRADVLQSTASMLKDQVAQKKYLDIGAGSELSLPLGDNPAAQIGISSDKFKTAVAMLKAEGYQVHTVNILQLGTGKETRVKVLAPPGVTQKEVWQNRDQIKTITDYSEDGGRSFLGLKPPQSFPSERLAIRYKEEGGADADGVIYVRPGVEDVSLGGAHYAQVRIAVDGTHFLKGMAVYKDDLPAGVDLMFNTNKSDTGNKLDALKPLKKDASGKIDVDNPFGAVIKPGGQRGVMNIINEEGDWETWSRTLSSQFLSKQSPSLIKTQLDMTLEGRKNQLDEIMKLTNPAVRKKLLESFADDADSAAVHLKAAALPRQASHVILPLNTMKENEIYAPYYKHGERVVLVRHPHGGTFEIPELVVNNNHPEGQKILGKGTNAARDAVGINSKVAARLSGADFDGDTVLVIPNNSGKVKSTRPLEGLKDFDPQVYKIPEGSDIKPISSIVKQRQMGDVSNLITDMTIKGASPSELARAVRHSMVVIDAEKHNLDYKASARDNGIAQLKTKYQGGPRKGASTLISRKKSEIAVPERKQGYRIDPATGKKIFTETGAYFTGKDGTTVYKKSWVKKLAETEDANTLSSGTVVEKEYADYSNRVKALADQARKEYANTKNIEVSPSARRTYADQVSSLDSKLTLALKNAPLERQAQIIANATVAQKKQAYPDMDKADLKKIQGQALAEARTRTGAGKQRIVIDDKEWEAIQAGAISNHKLTEILRHADLDQVKKLATPRENLVMTTTKQSRAKAMLSAGYSPADVARQLGVPVSTLRASMDRGEV